MSGITVGSWSGWRATIDKFRFELCGVVCIPNHVHRFLRAPEPNLSRGMQYLLSGYANWFSTLTAAPDTCFSTVSRASSARANAICGT